MLDNPAPGMFSAYYNDSRDKVAFLIGAPLNKTEYKRQEEETE